MHFNLEAWSAIWNFVLLQVIGARHLMKSGRGYVSPFVEIEIVGLDCDCNKFKTVTIRKSFLKFFPTSGDLRCLMITFENILDPD